MTHASSVKRGCLWFGPTAAPQTEPKIGEGHVPVEIWHIKVAGKKGDEPKAQDFKVADDTKAVTFAGDDKKEGTVKDAFKDVKEGTAVAVTLGEGDKVTAVQVGAAKKKEKK